MKIEEAKSNARKEVEEEKKKREEIEGEAELKSRKALEAKLEEAERRNGAISEQMKQMQHMQAQTAEASSRREDMLNREIKDLRE